MKRKAISLFAAFAAAAMLLGSCNFGLQGIGEKDAAYEKIPPETVVSATPYEGPEAGEYFNASAMCVLRLDGDGGIIITALSGKVGGTYTATETEICLRCGGEEVCARFSGSGLMVSGVEGVFLPVEERENLGELGLIAPFDREYSEDGEGGMSFSDYILQLGLRYPEEFSAPENLIADAAVVWDRASGYVTGRNVTEDFASGTAEEFMAAYMEEKVASDFRLLYDGEGVFESITPLSEGVEGRLASSEGVMAGAGERIYVKCIMYTSTYADGTVNYICKCFFAPEGDAKSFNALANGVQNMTAVRRR